MRDADTRRLAHTLPCPIARAVCAMDAEAERGGGIGLDTGSPPRVDSGACEAFAKPTEASERPMDDAAVTILSF
jgi:hypothetical protein